MRYVIAGPGSRAAAAALPSRADTARKGSLMRKLPLVLLLPVLAAVPALWEPARAQNPIQPQLLYARQRQIAIPFDPDPAEAHRLKQLQLFYSTDKGRTWQLGATAAPEMKKFNFLAETDGLYLFAVQTTDLSGRVFPEKMDGVAAGLRVVIDTANPILNLKPLPPNGNQVGVAWDIRDDNFDAAKAEAIRLEYRSAGNPNWLPLYPLRAVNGQHYWPPGTQGLCDVRMRATDLAGNFTDATTQVSLGGQGGFAGPPTNPGGLDTQIQSGAGGLAPDPGRRFISTKRITLNYEITESGPSGISGIDLWYTNNGRSWTKFLLPKNAINDPTFKGPLTIDVEGEGVYGFTLVPKSGVGISAPPPQIGEKPQIWIEVDLTKPFVELQSVLVGTGAHKGKLSINWLARDKNFGKTPMTLGYATVPEGPYTPIAANLPNNGSYVWEMPVGNMPWQFYIKVQAADLAGNIGEAVTPGLVKVDTLQPKAKIIDVQSGG
jgi:hypothetical protein